MGSASSFANIGYMMNTAGTQVSLFYFTLLFLSSDLSPPDVILPSGYRNWISGKRNSRMLEFQECFQDAKKNSSVMSQWHHDGRSGK